MDQKNMKPTTKNYITIKKLNIGPVPTLEILLENCDPVGRLNQIIYKAYAAALNLSNGNQTEAAHYLGVAISSVHNFVHGKKRFRYYHKQKLLSQSSETKIDLINS
jgi:hypothetical protein